MGLVGAGAILATVGQTAPAHATVSVWSHVYTSETAQQENGDVMLAGYHTATTDNPEFPVCVEGWLMDPNGSVLDTSGIICEITTTVAADTRTWLNESTVVGGAYEAETSGSDAGSSHGCASQFGTVTNFNANYQYNTSNSVSHIYSRCDLGSCLIATMAKDRFPFAIPPPFVRLFVIRVQTGIGGPGICFFWHAFPIPGCSA